jgi:hypothetical protein
LSKRAQAEEEEEVEEEEAVVEAAMESSLWCREKVEGMCCSLRRWSMWDKEHAWPLEALATTVFHHQPQPEADGPGLRLSLLRVDGTDCGSGQGPGRAWPPEA